MEKSSTIKIDLQSLKLGIEVGIDLYSKALKEINSYYYAGKKYGWLKYKN